ncbi:MAG: rhodanese-like domain-containing protein [Woeseia sp.]
MSPVESAVPQSLMLGFLADKSTFTLIDARSPEEYATTHIDGAVNIPHDQLADYDQTLPASLDKTVVVYCRTGKRAGELQAQLTQLGYTDVRVLQPQQIFASDNLMVFNCGASESKSLVVNKTATTDAREEESPQ